MTQDSELKIENSRLRTQNSKLRNQNYVKSPQLVALSLVALVASSSAQSGAPPRVPGIDTAGMDRSVRPQDDFFRFVNGLWSDKTPIPADRSNYGTFAELRDRAQEAVRGILEAEAIKTEAPGSIGQKVEIGRASG